MSLLEKFEIVQLGLVYNPNVLNIKVQLSYSIDLKTEGTPYEPSSQRIKLTHDPASQTRE